MKLSIAQFLLSFSSLIQPLSFPPEWSLRSEMGDFEPAMQLSIDPSSLETGDTVAPDADQYRTLPTAELDKLTMESGDAMVADTVKADVCPFLSLPKDILRLIFKNHLSAADRLRARVTRGLWEMESEESYVLWKLNIVDDDEHSDEDCGCCCAHRQPNNKKLVTMLLTKSTDVYVDGLAKLTANSTFDIIEFKISQPAYGDLLATVQEIPAARLIINIKDDAAQLLTEERVVQLMRGRTKLIFLQPIPSLTAEMIVRLFESMESGADSIRDVKFYDAPSSVVRSALSTLGLDLCSQGHLHASRRNIEAYLWTKDFFILFDDRYVAVQAPILFDDEPGLMSIERWEVDGSKGRRIFSKDEIREYLCKIPLLYGDEVGGGRGVDDDEHDAVE